MADLFKESTPKARKDHKCNLCGQKIEKGHQYTRWEYLMDGEFRSDAYHMKCVEAIHAYCEDLEVQEFDLDSVFDWTQEEGIEVGP